MNLEIEYILVMCLILLWFDIVIVLRTLSNKSMIGLAEERAKKEQAELVHLFEVSKEWDDKKLKRLFDNYLKLKQSIDLPEDERRRILEMAMAERKKLVLKRHLGYKNKYKRMEAALGLALVADDFSREALEQAIRIEKDFPVRLYIANALADIKDQRSLPALVDSLLGAHRWYRDKVNMLIASFGLAAREYVSSLFQRDENEVVELLIDMGGSCVCEQLKDYLVALLEKGTETLAYMEASVGKAKHRSCAYCVHGRKITEDFKRDCPYEGKVAPEYSCARWQFLVTSANPAANHRRLLAKAAENVAKFYAPTLHTPFFLSYPLPEVRDIAIRSLGRGNSPWHVETLASFLTEGGYPISAKIGLSALFSEHPRLIPRAVEIFETTQDKKIRLHLAESLAGRIEYFIYKLTTKESAGAQRLIREVIEQGKYSEIIAFLSHNKDKELEEALVSIITEMAATDEDLRKECGLYLPDRILAACGLDKIVPPQKKREEAKDKKMIYALYFFLVFAIGFFPFLYLIRYSATVRYTPIVQQLKTFVVDFNYDFAYYSITVNVTYMVLLGLSAIKVRNSTKLWSLKTKSMLFKPRMLPSVSILAPAYNEEKTIIESANSLLNLKYPDYELVVVNDGSRDRTLDTLIEYFSLKRVDHYFVERLKTAPVRGIYKNPLYPRLTVVDKENGGKADSLNAGINIASREYFCGIDADSLLESDSLLKVASLTLDYGVETPAMGGNVFPINGCVVDKGKLMHIGLPKHILARLQTIEYLRAFMCGRLGWTQLNSLLIISGAFGLFRRERVISIGGYLTSKERFNRDTVGEDMELVVRISRLMREKKQKYRVGYAFNANCWTEVPESMKILKRQRDRWHRGLIDIMYFHRKLLFNPAYGRMGLLGMPYFLIFETIGPLFEIQGYLMVALAAFFGLISTKLALLLFFSTILMGILISVSAVLIAERQVYYFNYRETLRMFLMALGENFGPRQLFSFWRVLGFLNAMKKPQGWGKMERKGFGPAKAGQETVKK